MDASAQWDLSCPNWIEKLKAGAPLLPDGLEDLLFQSEAAAAVKFFDDLTLPNVPGTPRMGMNPNGQEGCGPWFRDSFVRPLFGSRDPETNIRYIPEVFGMVGKGNSKTTYSAGLMLTALLMNLRPRAEFYFIGETQAIADLAFDQTEGMIIGNRELKNRFKIVNHEKEIEDRVNGSKLMVKTFNLNVLTGPMPAGILLDELHLLGKHPHAVKILRQIRGGLKKNTEGFLIIITTQSDEPPVGVFKDELMAARSTRDGKFAGRLLPIIYELPPDISKPVHVGETPKWHDPKYWPWVMPNLGRSLQLGTMIADFETEKIKGQQAVTIWASQHLNIELGINAGSDRWAGTDFWPQNAEKTLTLDNLLRRCEVVVVGIDGGGLDDLLGLVVIGRERQKDGKGKWLCWVHAWAHQIVLSRRLDIVSKLQDFEAEKTLTIVGKPGDDVVEVADIVMRIEDTGLLAEKHAIGVDAAGIGDIVTELTSEERGLSIDRIVGISQGWKLNGAIKTTERAVAAGKIIHDGSAMMAWCVGNAKQIATGNAISVTKQVSGSAKIDPVMAMFNAVSLMMLNPEAAGSAYEDDDVEV